MSKVDNLFILLILDKSLSSKIQGVFVWNCVFEIWALNLKHLHLYSSNHFKINQS